MKIAGGSLYVAAVLLNWVVVYLAAPVLAKTAVQCSRNRINFGKQALPNAANPNSSSPPQTVTISNTGKAISSLDFPLMGSDASDFQESTDCPTDLGTGAKCHVTVTFIPTRTHRRLATLMVAYQGNPDAEAVKLSGTGVQTGQVITPPQVDFGKVHVGAKSRPKTITVKNPNSVSVAIESITTSGPFAVVGKTCGSSLGAGRSCYVTMTFTPTSACSLGLQTGALTVATAAAATPAQTRLSGTAVQNAQTAIFVTNSSSNALTIYPLSADGNVEPLATIGDPVGVINPQNSAVDSKGNVYVANPDAGAHGSVSIYTSCGNGTVAAIASISGTNTGLQQPWALALDSAGNIYVANTDSVSIFPPLGNRAGTLNESPTATITGPKTALGFSSGIALDSSGRIYVSEAFGGPDSNGSVMVYPPLASSSGTLNEAPIATIVGSNTGLNNPYSIALDSRTNIYVLNFGGGPSITVYPPFGGSSGNLNETPTATITGPNVGLAEPEGIALDSSGRIYVADSAGGPDLTGSVTVFPPIGNSTGVFDEAPTAVIAGSLTGLAVPVGVVLDAADNIFVTNLLGGPSFSGSVVVYPPLLGGTGILNETPTTTIGASASGLDNPIGVALDSDGRVYVTNFIGGSAKTGSVTVYSSGSSGDVSPIATISASNIGIDNTGLDEPTGIAVDLSGKIYVGNLNSITVYPAGSNGNVAPIATIAGGNTGLNGAGSIALDSSEDIYVATGSGVAIYPPLGTSTGTLDESPVAIIAGPNTGLSAPTGVGLDSIGNIYIAGLYGSGPLLPAAIFLYPPLGISTGVLDEPPIAVITGSNTGLDSPNAIALDPSARIYATNPAQGPFPGSVTVYQPLAGSTGILNEVPVASITGSETQLVFSVGIAIGPYMP